MSQAAHDEKPRIEIGPEEEARVHAITRPDPGLMKVYFFQALAGTFAIQTASAKKGADESLEGLREFDLVQAYLREKMKGKKAARPALAAVLPAEHEAIALIASIRDEVRALRTAVSVPSAGEERQT